MRREKFFEQLEKVKVPHRFSLLANHLLLLNTLRADPCKMAHLAFKFGFLQGQRAAEVEGLKRTRADLEHHAPGYGLLMTLIERHQGDQEYVRWLLPRARTLDRAYQEIEEAQL